MPKPHFILLGGLPRGKAEYPEIQRRMLPMARRVWRKLDGPNAGIHQSLPWWQPHELPFVLSPGGPGAIAIEARR